MIIERVLWCLMLGFIFDLKKRQIASEKWCQVFSKNIFYMSHVMLNRYNIYANKGATTPGIRWKITGWFLRKTYPQINRKIKRKPLLF